MRKLTRKQVAAELELTDQAISLLAKEDGCPREVENGKQVFRWPEFNRWYWGRKLEEARAVAEPADYEKAKARREAALAQQEELKLAEMRGNLMTVEQYERVVQDAFQRVRSQLLTLPNKLAPAVVGTETTQEGFARVEPLIREVMDELHAAADVPTA